MKKYIETDIWGLLAIGIFLLQMAALFSGSCQRTCYGDEDCSTESFRQSAR